MKPEKHIVFLSVIVFACFAWVSCERSVHDDRAKALEIVERYGSQNGELQKLYDYALLENDGDIMFLIANMEYKSSGTKQVQDILNINADSLIASVEYSRRVWAGMPWAGQYTEQQFREYVLPYKMGKEPLEYYWKQDAFDRYNIGYEVGEDISGYAKRYNIGTSFRINTQLKDNEYGYHNLSQVKTGNCADWTLFCVLGLRAAGIPAAEHVIVQWGDYNNSHSIPALIFPDETSINFEDHFLAENNLDKAIPKLYRRMYSIQDDTPIFKYRDTESIPKVFERHDLQDVSDKYPMHTIDVAVEIPKALDRNSRIVYLSVFSFKKWVPVAYAEKKGRKATFKYVGTGHQITGEFVANGYDIGEGIVYLPVFYIDDKAVPAAHALIAGRNGTKTLVPDTVNKQKLVLQRKFPCKTYTMTHFHDMKDATFEASNDLKSERWDRLHKVYEPPTKRVNKIPVDNERAYKYVRVRMPKGRLSIAELRFYDQNGNLIKGSMVSDEYVLYFGVPVRFL